MRNALFALIVLIIASCSTLPKMAPHNPECNALFQIRSPGYRWHDIRLISSEGNVINKNMLPNWYNNVKSQFDGYNEVLFNHHSKQFLAIKYECFDFTYTQKIKEADKRRYEQYCLAEKREILNRRDYEYKYSIPQTFTEKKDFEGNLKFSVSEQLLVVPTNKNVSDFAKALDMVGKPGICRLTLVGDYNNGRGFNLAIMLISEGGGLAHSFKSVIESISFREF
ncbi:MAG: hypothetical protein KQI78_04255 [Deltaproteobacteria bacterium]|nr:hypothetical protein [Deltaproteobacteria bacterium]